MKIFGRYVFYITLILSVSNNASATVSFREGKIGAIYWRYTVVSGSAVIGYKEDPDSWNHLSSTRGYRAVYTSNASSTYGGEVSGDIAIPETLGGYPVGNRSVNGAGARDS